MSSTYLDEPRWGTPRFNLEVVQPADGRVIAVVAFGAVAFDLGVRSGVVSVGGWLAVLVAALGLGLSGRLRTTASVTCAFGSVLLGWLLVLRVSPWLVPPDLAAAVGLLGLAAMLARDGRLDDLTVGLLSGRALAAVAHVFAVPSFLAVPLRQLSVPGDGERRRQLLAGVARGTLVSLPVVLVLGALLASADRIFAASLRVHVSVPGSIWVHVPLVVVGAGGVAGLLRMASARPNGSLPPTSWRLEPVEWTTVLGSVVVLLGGFAVVQVVTLTGGGRHVLETEGLTYAEYARSGYFQLLAATVLTALVLGGLAVVSQRDRPGDRARWIALSELTVGLTLVILLVAFRRLGLYEEAYGWTMLRLMAKSGAVWIGIVLVLLALRLAGVRRNRAWFIPASIAAGLGVLVVLNLVNPEAAVVRHNLARQDAHFDPGYLAGLSDDAMPTLVGSIRSLTAHDQLVVRTKVCAAERHSGLLRWNLSRSRADDARAELCGRDI
jgi:hypothetical protein